MTNIVIVFGCGGHRAQATRFHDIFSKDASLHFFGITDEGSCPYWADKFLVLGHFRDKYSGKLVSPLVFFRKMYASYRFIDENKITTLISFGPGVAIYVALAAKLKGCSIIHFETWSKFYSPTMTTKVMKYLTKNIFIQNIELKESIPYGKYVGRF